MAEKLPLQYLQYFTVRAKSQKELVKILKDFKNDEKFSIENAIAQNFRYFNAELV